MWSLASSNLLRERGRLVISVAGVAAAVMLMVLIRGLYVSYETKVGERYEQIGADAWVVQAGTADFFHSFSVVPRTAASQIVDLDGVAHTHPYVARQVRFAVGGQDTLVYLVGFDVDDPVTGPGPIVAGSTDVGSDGIVVDRVFARDVGVGVGDTLTIKGIDLQVVGVATGGDMLMYQYAYADTATARAVLEMTDLDNAVLVHLAPGADLGQVRRDLDATAPGLDVRDTAQVVADNQQVITGAFLPVIAVLLTIAFLVGTAVVGLTTYSAVLEKRREIGVLKAIGARGRQMVGLVAIQSLLAASAGYALGVALALAAAQASARWVPAFTTRILPGDVAWLALATVAMAAIASVVPLVRIARIDPGEVFRA